LATADPERRGSDQPVPGLAPLEDPSVVYFDPRPKDVCESEAVGVPELHDVVEDVRRRLIVVSQTP
jgi:hypothetical protein